MRWFALALTFSLAAQEEAPEYQFLHDGKFQTVYDLFKDGIEVDFKGRKLYKHPHHDLIGTLESVKDYDHFVRMYVDGEMVDTNPPYHYCIELTPAEIAQYGKSLSDYEMARHDRTLDADAPGWKAPGENSGKWWVKCSDDPIEDMRICGIAYHGLPAIAVGAGRVVVTFGNRDIYPNTNLIVRVGDHKPVRWEKDSAPQETLMALVGQLKSGDSKVLTRYTKWPSGDQVTESWFSKAESFKLAWKLAQAKLADYKEP